MRNKILFIIVVAAILGALATLGYVMTTPKISEEFTEFYITGREGKVEKYPSEFTLDSDGKVILVKYINVRYIDPEGEEEIQESSGKVTLVVENHEQQTVEYIIKMTIGERPGQIELKEGAEQKVYDELTFSLNNEGRQDYRIGFVPHELNGSTKLISPALQGQNKLMVESLSLFDAGDYILVGEAGSDENIQIAAIDRDQSAIIITTELKYDHSMEVPVLEQEKVEFTLYKSGEDKPYATLHLWIHVKRQA